jgi:hypothetical protein
MTRSGLGLLYKNDANRKRWMLKSNNTKTISEIDAVFVTSSQRAAMQRQVGSRFYSPIFVSARIIPGTEAWSTMQQSGLARVQKARFIAMLVDFNIRSVRGDHPKMGNGLELIRQLHALELTATILTLTPIAISQYPSNSKKLQSLVATRPFVPF